MNVFVFMTVNVVMLLRDSGPYVFCLCVGWLVGDHFLLSDFRLCGMIFMTVCGTALDYSVVLVVLDVVSSTDIITQ
jgi:hypothetical protein